MHLCMKRSSPHASMPVSFSFPFQFKAGAVLNVCQEGAEALMTDHLQIAKEAEVHVFAILQINTARCHLLAAQLGAQTHGEEHCICVPMDSPIMIGPETLCADRPM